MIWAPDSSQKIGSKCCIHHCQGWKEGSFVCETVWFFSWVNTHLFDFFRGWILICLTWNLCRFVPNLVEILAWNFRKNLFRKNFFWNYLQSKAILFKNLWNFGLLSAILFWVCIALKKFTQVLSYFFCTQARRHVHKQMTKRRYGEEKQARLVFGKSVLFALGLGLTTPNSFGILVWNFYQTFVTVSAVFWLRFEPQIRPTRLAINF